MGEPFIGEIKMVGFTYAPRDWADCYGQTINVNQNPALFALIVPNFGGDGQSTFQLPDLRGRVPIHPGRYVRQGQWGGAERVSITGNTFPKHTHSAMQSDEEANSWAIHNKKYPNRALGRAAASIYRDPTDLVGLHSQSVAEASGGSVPHSNLQPLTVIKYVIAMQGLFPSRS